MMTIDWNGRRGQTLAVDHDSTIPRYAVAGPLVKLKIESYQKP